VFEGKPKLGKTGNEEFKIVKETVNKYGLKQCVILFEFDPLYNPGEVKSYEG